MKPALWALVVLVIVAITAAVAIARSSSQESDPRAISNWFHVSFDVTNVTLKAAPPGGTAWEQSFTWNSIVRVCFKTEGMELSDGLYIFTSQRPESFVVPTEASGGTELLNELMRRKHLPADIVIKASGSPEGTLLCWPALPGHDG